MADLVNTVPTAINNDSWGRVKTKTDNAPERVNGPSKSTLHDHMGDQAGPK